MTDPLRAVAQAVSDQAELDDSGFDGECLDYHVPIPALDALRAALAYDASIPPPHSDAHSVDTAPLDAAFDSAVLAGRLDDFDVGTVRRFRDALLPAVRLAKERDQG